jgi:hypothetical protein
MTFYLYSLICEDSCALSEGFLTLVRCRARIVQTQIAKEITWGKQNTGIIYSGMHSEAPSTGRVSAGGIEMDCDCILTHHVFTWPEQVR